jgi:hypothetical protein
MEPRAGLDDREKILDPTGTRTPLNPRRNNHRYPLNRRPQKWSERLGQENISPLPGLQLRPLGRTARQYAVLITSSKVSYAV